MYRSVFDGKRALVTGHTGFKGAWLSVYLRHLGAEVMGYALEPPTDPSLYSAIGLHQYIRQHVPADVRDSERLRTAILDFQPDFVFHLAAQPLVLASYQIPRETFEVNLIGTLALLDAVRELNQPCIVIVVSTDKCYENLNWPYSYRETDTLGGKDPYSASKAAMEIAVASYRQSFFAGNSMVRLASARAGNVIGGGDWAEHRIVPDIIRHLRESKSVPIRNPHAIRPWQHVLEPLSGYLWLAAQLCRSDWQSYAEAWNFGPLTNETHTVADLVGAVIAEWGSGEWAEVSQSDAPYEAAILKLSIDKTAHRLQWRPTWSFHETVGRTTRWYRLAERAASQEAYRLTLDDICAYEDAARQQGQVWIQ